MRVFMRLHRLLWLMLLASTNEVEGERQMNDGQLDGRKEGKMEIRERNKRAAYSVR